MQSFLSLEELKSHHNTLTWPSVDHTNIHCTAGVPPHPGTQSHQQLHVGYTSQSPGPQCCPGDRWPSPAPG